MHAVLVILFVSGYCAIALERPLRINKAGVALLTGVACWTVFMLAAPEKTEATRQLLDHLGGCAGILFFLMGAMAIVELIGAHDGFSIITNAITTNNKRALLWIICFICFFLSAVLDNLTTAIVMISLVSKLMRDRNDFILFASMVVIAANAGGAWSPIGDVTTTMLWIDGRVTSTAIMTGLIFPSLTSLAVPLAIVSLSVKGTIDADSRPKAQAVDRLNRSRRGIVFFTGIGALLFVPVFKALTGLPPVMGIILGLGVLWVVIELMYKNEPDGETDAYSVAQTIRRIDLPSILFFLGILLSVAALESAGILPALAAGVVRAVKNTDAIVFCIGLLSAIVDNVPLVAGAMGMFDVSHFPRDHQFWIFLAYCAGTGGSCLIIGSAAGVVAMGLAKIDFIWYLKKISWLALAGYCSGAVMYLLQRMLIK